ncbi:DUF2905 domain-containing protein [Thermodesulfobacterium hveragerdense]|uniref:DUF2905 domain-containing protein n=1 Tax=Thermodesulfobacterium hveragerdense TaxID=53424 RepID=UPI00048BF90B|nr:DUF2905 domain-containing protein [Thermodesulfobacterium hveragerdense]
MSGFGKFLVLLGFCLILLGIFISLLPKIPYIGKLPGDIYIKKDNFTFYFPLATSILISLLLTIILNLIFRK